MSCAELGSILRRMLRSGDFWLAALSMSLTCTLKRTLEILLALYFRDASAPGVVTNGEAAQLAVVWSAGLATSVLAGGWLFNRLEARGKIVLVGGLMGVTILGCACMAALSATLASTPGEVATRAAVAFATALGVGLPYYVPTGIFSVRFGEGNSGVVSAYLDVVAFAFSGGFIGLVVRRVLGDGGGASGGWANVWWLLTGLSVAMLLLQLAFLRMLFFRLLPPAAPPPPPCQAEIAMESSSSSRQDPTTFREQV